MKDNRAPGSIWCLSRDNWDTYVRTEVNDQLVLVAPDLIGAPTAVYLSRKDARLLAKRINECLDATVKK